MTAPTIHACAVALGECGVLIRGAPGTGKTALALALVSRFQDRGIFAALVADDRVALTAAGGALIARPAAPLRGMVELRGAGIAAVPYLPAVRLTHVADMTDAPARMPDPPDIPVAGMMLPHICLRAGQPETGATLVWTLLQGSAS